MVLKRIASLTFVATVVLSLACGPAAPKGSPMEIAELVNQIRDMAWAEEVDAAQTLLQQQRGHQDQTSPEWLVAASWLGRGASFAERWDDPSLVRLAPLPKFSGGDGSTVFWTTGCALLKHGQNKERAAEYLRDLTYDRQIWKDSIAGPETGRPGQLPPYRSIYSEWKADLPSWLPDYVALVRAQLDRARAIETHLFGLQQFFIGQPLWESYLKGKESNPRVALKNASDAVRAEIDRN